MLWNYNFTISVVIRKLYLKLSVTIQMLLELWSFVSSPLFRTNSHGLSCSTVMLSPSCLVGVWLRSLVEVSWQHLLELTITRSLLWTWWPAWCDSLSGVWWQLTKWQRLGQSSPCVGSVHYSPQLWAEARTGEWVAQ